ncbi:hypothetical protein [Methylopila sp. M107]|uniref:hypothetical protein n=1 Tax=Methylopila sp. M107 TaxID=1101190 RepID=UPI0003719D53|nr:hypothetical protein [Methylopila sp. M107]
MILVDTSLWIDHLGKANETLMELLLASQILSHPYIVGEVALGDLPNRARTIESLLVLPRAVVAATNEVPPFIERHNLFGTGIGYVDAHLLMSALLTPDAKLWTRDKRLNAAAVRLGVAADFV